MPPEPSGRIMPPLSKSGHGPVRPADMKGVFEATTPAVIFSENLRNVYMKLIFQDDQ